jgi:hypothetical protein
VVAALGWLPPAASATGFRLENQLARPAGLGKWKDDLTSGFSGLTGSGNDLPPTGAVADEIRWPRPQSSRD